MSRSAPPQPEPGPEPGIAGGALSGGRAGSLGLLLVALVVGVYAGSWEAGFAWLDQREILQGGLRVHDWPSFWALFRNDGNYAGYHRPLYNLAHSLDWALWGPDPRGFHLTSLAWHAANAWLLYRLLLRLGRSAGFAWAVAALFALHPVHTAVAGLIHSKADLLVTALSLLAAHGAVGAARGDRRSALWGSCAFLLATQAKELALVYPAGLGLMLVSRGGWRQAAPALRLHALAVGALTLLWLGHRFAIAPEGTPAVLGLGERLATFLPVYAGYLRKLLWPSGLSVADTVTRWSALGSGAQLHAAASALLIAAGMLLAARRWPRLWPWVIGYHLALLPVAQVVPILHFKADRYLYLPGLFLAGFAVGGVAIALGRLEGDALARARMGAGLVLGGVCIAYGARVQARLPFLRDDFSLFEEELRRTPDYREGLSILALAHDRRQRFEEAAGFYERALEENPARVSYLDRGGTLLAYSKNLLARQRPAEAVALIDAVLPSVKIPLYRLELGYNRSVARFHLGEHAAALEGFEVYRQTRPDDPGALYFSARCLLALKRPQDARAALERYLLVFPRSPDRAEIERVLAELARTGSGEDQ